ncbi:MAG: UDP-4-amino-4,6-dideoxy-N-acetyl-beta-L-altrosamine transaminase [Deltaproteobacteria bacterium RIFOXYD12_FULL_56_24]|nr:MAG: UDP-4-amino-4,6-dideoxy-N-acetyl-beta-L-altrosamine transaminase [Deltaproteobacteria bacterium RIFOXYD12_FULL_56_24]
MSPPPSSAASPDFLPYGRQLIEEDDIAAVVAALRSDWLTTGPRVGEFEAAVCAFTGVQYGVAVSSGTAALHAAMYALGIGPGDEVIVPAMTFAATANCVVYQGGTPVFADVEPDTLLIDPMDVARRITAKTRAIIAVDYAGQPCDYYALRDLAQSHGLALVADACHSLGGSYKGKRVGTLADLTVFSFHPVKHITTGEGGMVVTDNPELAARMRRFRNHGIDTDHRQREASGTWAYQMVGLGYNYRLTDLQAALGTNQLAKLPGWLEKRRVLAAIYDAALAKVAAVRSIVVRPNNEHAYHLYVVRLVDRDMRGRIFAGLRQHSIGANVHYLPVHLHPYYREVFHTVPGLCPNAEAAYDCILTLPLHQGMDEADVDRVVHVLKQELVA